MSSLQEKGFRFVWRDKQAKWIHPAEVRESDIDLTDFDDDMLMQFIRETTNDNC